jgi:hypothetical protein
VTSSQFPLITSGLQVALPMQRVGEIEVRLGRLRIDAHRVPEHRNGLIEFTLIAKQDSGAPPLARASRLPGLPLQHVRADRAIPLGLHLLPPVSPTGRG